MKSAPQTKNNAGKADQDIILEQQQIIASKIAVIAVQDKRIKMLEDYLRLAKQKQFGRSSEKNPAQGEIFNEAELTVEALEAGSTKNKKPHKKRGRKGFSKNTAREQIFINLSSADKEGAIDTFYSKIKEELDIVPAKVRVLEYMQEKAVFRVDGQRQMKAATPPKHPIGKVMASVGLLAYIIIAKYMDGLSLYRLESILRRYGGEVTRTRMASWIINLSMQCQPLIHLMRAHQLSGSIIQIDETRSS